ncbi:MAG: OmpH family outer membrane protein [Prevotellaceae bacterium]|nr:OmpH family outer membrane protein [Prevotellaceae bacterium]
MKKLLVLFAVLAFPVVMFAQTQRFAYVDTEYILGKIPNFQSATDQIEKLATQYQKEVEEGYKKLDETYNTYQAEKALLNESMRKKREDEIIARERELKNTQQKYFGPEGELFTKREELLKPIQEQVTEAINKFAEEGGYSVIFDLANNPSMVYTNPRYDMSDKILEKLGFK